MRNTERQKNSKRGKKHTGKGRKRKMTRVVHCKKEKYDVYIGRSTKFGNPFIIGRDATKKETTEMFEIFVKVNTNTQFSDLEFTNSYEDVLIKLIEELS